MLKLAYAVCFAAVLMIVVSYIEAYRGRLVFLGYMGASSLVLMLTAAFLWQRRRAPQRS